MKKSIFFVFILTLIFGAFDSSLVLAQDDIEINFFYSRTCPYCAKENKFLDELENKYPEIKINRFGLFEKENIDLLVKFYSDYNVPSSKQGLVPITFFGNRYFSGFSENIKKEIEDCVLGKVEENHKEICQCGECSEKDSQKISIPFVGEIYANKYSLPVLSVVLGTLDGFNVCSLGALILILTLVLALKSKKKILIFGGLFIFTTAIVYGILIVIWYQIFRFFAPYLKIMEILIGILAIGAGIYFFKQFLKFKKYGSNCEISTGKRIISKFSSKFQQSLNGSGNILLLIGFVLVFAIIITIVEFPCSAAIPVVFAGILANSHLSSFFYLLYIAIFLLFYMLDEIIIFLIAFFTMKIWLASSKSIIWITLIEAIILFILGFYYLFGFNFLL